MKIHQVQVEKPALIAKDAQELDGTVYRVEVGPGLLEGRVLPVDGGWRGTAYGLGVDLKTLVEAEVAFHPAISEQPRGAKTGLGEYLCGQPCLGREYVLKPRDTGPRRVEPRPEGGHGALRPGRLRDLTPEADPGFGHLVEQRAGWPVIAPSSEVIGA